MEIKIIHVVLGKANPNRPNGVNKVVNSLATEQSNQGFNVAIWGITKKLIKNYPERNYETLIFNDPGKFKIDPNIRLEIEALDPQQTIFHFHGGFIPQFFLVAKLLHQRGFQFVYTPHGAYNPRALKRSKFKKKIYSWLFERFMLRNAKYVHTLFEGEAQGVHDVYKNANCIVIPNGQSMLDLKYSFDKIDKENDIVFGFVGRIDINTKGLDILINGFQKYLNEVNKKAQLWIIGDGKELDQLKQLASDLNISEKVRFWGGRYAEEKLNLMANMDYLVLTSRNEGIPGVVLEASGLGVPGIISRETNLAEQIIECSAGIVLEENTPSQLMKAMSKANDIIDENQWEVLGENAKEMIKNKFSWKDISMNFIRLYEV